jgi:hypothetical protein
LTKHLAILLIACIAAAMDLGGKDQISDPDLVAEMKKAGEANLENAMSRGRKEALEGVEHMRVLMLGSRGVVQGALTDIRGVIERKSAARAGTLEDSAEQLRLSDQLLGEKTRNVLGRARIADLPPATRTVEDLQSARARYSHDDRAGDLKAIYKYVKQGRKKYKQPKGVLLTEAQDALLSAASAFGQELQTAEKRLKGLRYQLKKKHRKLGASAYVERLDARLRQLKNDGKAFHTERLLLEHNIRLMVLDEIAFDIVPE